MPTMPTANAEPFTAAQLDWKKNVVQWGWQDGRPAAQLGLTPPQLLVHLILVQRVNPARRCAWPSYADLAARTGLSPRAVGSAVQALKKAGAWRVEPRYQQANRYYPILTWRGLGTPLPGTAVESPGDVDGYSDYTSTGEGWVEPEQRLEPVLATA